MLTRKTASQLGWYLFGLSWIPFIGIFSYVFYPIDEWLPPISIICLVLSLGMMALGVILLMMSSISATSANRKIRESGVKGQARVISVEDAGTRYNNHFVLNVGLHIAPDFGPAFDTVASQLVPIYHMAQIQKGNVVNVLYLKDTKEAVIEFD